MVLLTRMYGPAAFRKRDCAWKAEVADMYPACLIGSRAVALKQPMDTTIPPLASIGIDIGKEVFHIVGFSTDGKIAFRRKVKRLAFIEAFKKLPPSVVGMEACLSARDTWDIGKKARVPNRQR